MKKKKLNYMLNFLEKQYKFMKGFDDKLNFIEKSDLFKLKERSDNSDGVIYDKKWNLKIKEN